MRKLLTLTLFMLLFAVVAAGLPPWLSVEKEGGVFNIEQARFNTLHFGPGHALSHPAKSVFVKRQDGGVERSGALNAAGFRELFTPLGADSFRYRAEFSSAEPSETLGLMLEFQLRSTERAVTVDSRDFLLPAEYDAKKASAFGRKVKCGRFTLPLDSGSVLTVTGECEFRILDKRDSGSEAFAVRIYFLPSAGKLENASLDLTFSLKKLNSSPVSLAAVANMGFRDEVAGDGRGGWTDQGPANDLSAFRPGRFTVGGTFFDIADPARNGGRAALVLGQKFPHEASVEAVGRGNWLNLLHAAAWTQPGKAGEIHVTFRDGSVQKIGVDSFRDVGNWWRPGSFPNAAVVWNGENGENEIGLYFTQFRLDRDDPVRLAFRAFDRQLWLLAGVTLSDGALPRQDVMKKTVLKAGREWVRLDSPRTVLPGSPLDFSGMLDAPAGKYGRVVVAPDGGFTFENAPEKRVRFVGVNLCFAANFLEKSDADALAERLARHGYNAVRIHHQDNGLVRKGAPDSLTLDGEQLDKLEYLFAACKKRGIYITTDVFVSRKLKADDNIPELDPESGAFQMKALLPISRSAMENWKEFARRWLGHRNPYTGMTWAEDPALYIVSFTNENNLYAQWHQAPEIAKLYRQLFPQWMAENRPGEPAGEAALSNRRFLEFLYTLQHRSILEQAKFLKEELKLRALRTDVNMHNKIPLALIREDLDTVDDHKYHDHPRFPLNRWRLPNVYRQRSSIGALGYEVPELLFAARLFGKPFSITEYKFCLPNRYRSEGGPLIGGYAALQGWDALYQFAWSHSEPGVNEDRQAGTFDFANEPLAQLSDRQTMLLFRRGDVAPSQAAFAWDVPKTFWDSDMPVEYPVDFSRLGFLAKIGNTVGGRRLPGVTVLDPSQAAGETPLPDAAVEKLRRQLRETGVAVSSTGELRLDSGKKTLAVDTPRTLSVTLASGALSAGRLAVAGVKEPATVSVSSLDGRPVAESRRLLLFHLTNVLDSGTTFEGDGMKRLVKWGTLPHLVRRDRAGITLKLDGAAPAKVEALRLDGSPYGEVKSEFRDGTLTFTADPGLFPGGVMVYWITR
ncbi:MAG: hypothetical protein HPZ91_08400 [Lentisphaeria bacterium]|nr:hypothetical protein [Lentisphaeria bacterium]